MLNRTTQWVLGFGMAGLAISALATDPYRISLINLIAISTLTAASLRFVMLIGELNMAVAASVGLGAYGAGAATTILHLPLPVAIVVGAVVSTVISVAFGAITLRVKGPYFMLMGFAFTEAMRLLYTKISWLGGTSGMVGIFPPDAMAAWMPTFVVAVVFLLILLLLFLESMDFGKVMAGIRYNEDVVRSLGIDVTLFKILCFAIASFCAGTAGALHAFVNNVISPADYGFILGVFALTYVKIGGESSIVGPIFGAIFLVSAGSYALGLGTGEHLFYGAVIILSMMMLPQGALGLASSGYQHFLASRKRLPTQTKPG